MKHGILAGVLAAGVALAGPPELEPIRERAKQLRESDTEGWRRIPWAASLTDAARAAKQEGRPMFVFTHDGNIDTGRC
jgi:hypothetical protein